MTTFKTIITSSAQVVRVNEDGSHTILFGEDRYIPTRIAEQVTFDLNRGFMNVKIEDYE